MPEQENELKTLLKDKIEAIKKLIPEKTSTIFQDVEYVKLVNQLREICNSI